MSAPTLSKRRAGGLSRRAAPLAPLPAFTPDRLLDRVAEAIQVGLAPEKFAAFPTWTQRVMRILKEQFVPAEIATILQADGAIFAEGIAVALTARTQDRTAPAQRNGRFARQLAERLALDAHTQEVAAQVETGAIAATPEFREQIIRRLFAPDPAARRAFVEGLAIGTRLPELLDRHARSGTTDATGIYLLLWLYWPEISRLGSIGQVAHSLAPFFAANKNAAGAHWDERIRKLANRLGLSFRARQTTRRKRRSAG